MLKDAKKAWLEAALEDQITIPEPEYDEMDSEEYSGRILIIVPKLLHKQLIQKAETDGLSLNQYCIHKLTI
ncbi:MAG: toxin-antitoxin system HicB family antitoxin [Oscillospiraceae bacterium]|nr:toxin-antitoxin system HicB family antitoxin [Oscillospiraceae bacterium]